MAPGYFVQMNEFLHTVRIIPIDPNRKHLDAKYHLFQGDPIAHWDGDTLVVDTTNQNDKTWFDLLGQLQDSTNLHVTEKFIPSGRQHHRVRSHDARSDHLHAGLDRALEHHPRPFRSQQRWPSA